MTFPLPPLLRVLLGAGLGCLVAAAAQAECLRPLLHRNQIPPSAIFLELQPESACSLAFGTWTLTTSVQHSNTAIISFQHITDPDPKMVLDHERQERTARLSLGGPWDTQWSLTARHIEDSTGHWDGFMREFHHRLELPYSSRKVLTDYDYLYLLCNPDCRSYMTPTNALWVRDPESGWGDTILSFKQEIWRPEETLAVGWRVDLKVPNEKDRPTLGSGKPDHGFGGMVEGGIGAAIGWLWNIGLVFPQETEHTVFDQESVLLNTSGTVHWRFAEQWTAGVQGLTSSPRYRISGNPVKGLTDWQVLTALELRWRHPAHELRFALTEDLIYNNSEDFSLIAQWEWEFL